MSLRSRFHSFLSAFFLFACFSITTNVYAQTQESQKKNSANSIVLVEVLGKQVTTKSATPPADELVAIRDNAGGEYNAVLEHIIKMNASNTVIQTVLDDYAMQKGITPNQTWITQFKAKFQGDLSASEQTASSLDEIAKKQVVLFQTEKAMFSEFGGRVIFRQSNPQMPIDAYQALLKSYEQQGKLTFKNAKLAASFWASFTPPFQFEVPTSNVNFDKPWWL